MKITFVDQIFDFIQFERNIYQEYLKFFLSEIDAVNNRYVSRLESNLEPDFEISYDLNRWILRFSDKELEHLCWIIALLTDNNNIESSQFLYFLILERLELRGNLLERFLPSELLRLKSYLLDRFYKKPEELLSVVREGFCDTAGRSWSFEELLDQGIGSVRIRKKPRSRKLVWRKGYHDKGSLGKQRSDAFIEYTLEQKQVEEEERRKKILKDTNDFIAGFCE